MFHILCWGHSSLFLFQDNDHTWIHTVAKSLIGIQQTSGIIPNTYCIGKGSKVSLISSKINKIPQA